MSDDDKVELKEKQMVAIIDKTLQVILKDLSKDMNFALKNNKLTELKATYRDFPTIIFNRFNRNFGVKKVALKHLKDFLLCLKRVQKYTSKYSVMWYFAKTTESIAENL